MAKPTLEDGVILQTPQESQHISREKILAQLPKGTNVVVTDAILKSLATMEDDTSLPQNLLKNHLCLTFIYLVKVKALV